MAAACHHTGHRQPDRAQIAGHLWAAHGPLRTNRGSAKASALANAMRARWSRCPHRGLNCWKRPGNGCTPATWPKALRAPSSPWGCALSQETARHRGPAAHALRGGRPRRGAKVSPSPKGAAWPWWVAETLRRKARTTSPICEGIGALGLTIVSGLALGVDAAAHEALWPLSRQIAPERRRRTHDHRRGGTGLDRVYPSRHLDLAHRTLPGTACW